MHSLLMAVMMILSVITHISDHPPVVIVSRVQLLMTLLATAIIKSIPRAIRKSYWLIIVRLKLLRRVLLQTATPWQPPPLMIRIRDLRNNSGVMTHPVEQV